MNTFTDNTAHFFWHGQLSQLEKSCIQSFYKHGFKPILWSYENLHIENIEHGDASDILPKNHLTKYSQEDKISNLAAFADVFRINLLNKYDGWWFDTDCYCLKNYNDFKQLHEKSPIVIGFEDNNSIACGVLKCNKKICQIFLSKLNTLLTKYNNHLPQWGMIGPQLFTNCIKNNGLINHVLSPQYFYPIHYSNFSILYNTNIEDIINANNKIKNAYIVHLWNEFIVKTNTNKFNSPPTGSIMDSIYKNEYVL